MAWLWTNKLNQVCWEETVDKDCIWNVTLDYCLQALQDLYDRGMRECVWWIGEGLEMIKGNVHFSIRLSSHNIS